MAGFSFSPQGKPLTVTSTFTMAASVPGDNATLVCVDNCTLLSIDCYNTGPAGIRMALYNVSRTPVPATDTPVWIIYLPGQGKSEKTWPTGLRFGNGIGYALMPEQADETLTNGVIEALNIGFT